ncbi:hypothetical protein BCEP4_680015 [Burkholderia cepacia]|nr:hypothetical protein BCEP4_680015 [Burkholderia cepacia]
MSHRPHGQGGQRVRAPLSDGRAGRDIVLASILSQKRAAGQRRKKRVRTGSGAVTRKSVRPGW